MTPPNTRARRRLLACALALLFAQQSPLANASALPQAAPSSVGMSAARLAEVDAVVGQSIARKETPGAVVLVGRKGRVAWRKSYGARAVEPAREAMTADTVFDLASLTKVVATATSVMILVERGAVRLGDPLSRFIPEFKGEGRDRVTIEHLLTHRAGFAPDFDLAEQWAGYEEAMKRLPAERLRSAPGSRFVYSDLGYIALGEVVRRASGLALDEFARKNIFEPLGMRDTGFNPKASARSRIAPTERRRGQESYLGSRPDALAPQEADRWLRGEVHDPTSFRMGGVAGHAGLFSTADDLAVYCQMMLNGGEYGGARILSPLGVAAMTRARAVAEDGSARGLGWDVSSSFSANRGDLFTPGSFGHTGFTGTSLWIDPATETFVVFLSNRVHPDGKGDVGAVRGRVATIVASSIADAGVDSARAESARFASEVLASLARVTSANAASNAAANALPPPADAEVLTGIDVLERDNFKQLAGLRIGLVTNHTGRDRRGRQTIDVLREAANVRLVALFSPEHGIRGAADEKISDARDEKTGLPIYSLYGESRRPKPEHLKDLDAVVYDIQDVGARFYTYI
ncbi:MAG: serine hydrolase, partial [Pyrinomonadaceae bacterium]